eukprot:8462651-Lingulodinium_polyedra.AAC.1
MQFYLRARAVLHEEQLHSVVAAVRILHCAFHARAAVWRRAWSVRNAKCALELPAKGFRTGGCPRMGGW